MSSAPVVQSAPTHAATLSQPTAARPPARLPDLFVRCEDGASCPDAVGMLVVDADPTEEPGRCTVTLIRSDRVLTASHCLTPADRRTGASCSRTWVLFPQTAAAPAESIACQRVLAATEVVGDDALRQEHAVLQLDRRSARLPLAIEPHPPEPGSIVTVASITPHPIYGTTHALSTRLCRVIDSTPAERALGEAAANVGWLASCPIARGNSGSPVLDYEGRIRAIVHGGTALSSQFGVTSSLSSE
jgi:Trypsin-like peptidase domain